MTERRDGDPDPRRLEAAVESIDRSVTDLRADFRDLRAEMRADIGNVRTEMRTEHGEVRSEMLELRSQARGFGWL